MCTGYLLTRFAEQICLVDLPGKVHLVGSPVVFAWQFCFWFKHIFICNWKKEKFLFFQFAWQVCPDSGGLYKLLRKI